MSCFNVIKAAALCSSVLSFSVVNSMFFNCVVVSVKLMTPFLSLLWFSVVKVSALIVSLL